MNNYCANILSKCIEHAIKTRVQIGCTTNNQLYDT